MNIYRTIKSEVGSYDGIAVIEDKRAISYKELFADVEKTAAVLISSGIAPDSRVAINGENSYEYVVVCLALLSIDAVIVPISIHATAAESDNIIERIAVNFLISDKPGVKGFPLFEGNVHPYRIIPTNCEINPVALPDGRRPAFIRFSSGTTGSSKGVVLSHQAILERTAACTGLGITRGEHILWVLDMAFHFIVTILLFIRKSATIVICGRPVETKMISILRQFPIRLVYATPYHYRLMLSSSELKKEDMSGIRLLVSTAMKLTAADANDFRNKFNVNLAQAYGIIEIGLPCLNPVATEKIDSAGQVQPGYSVRINNPDPDGIGEILIRGPGMFDAYFSPFLPRNQACPDGWFNTGDLGYVDNDRYLFIVGRSKNVINFIGMKIFPDEVEAALCSHPLIAEARVYGRKDPLFSEIPVAEIVLKNPEQPVADLARQLRRYCFSRLSEYKVPKELTVVTAIPKTLSGKIARCGKGQ